MDNITLVHDWDHQPKIDYKYGHHVIRQNEQKILQEFMIRRKEGSLLILGQRGIGKTSAIITAINESKKSVRSIMPIIIKAPTITIPNDDDDGKIILINLIRSLYENIKNKTLDDDLNKKTKDLYKKSISSNNKHQIQNKNEIITRKNSKIRFGLKNMLLGTIVCMTPIIHYFFDYIKNFPDELLLITSIITISSIFIYMNFTYEKNSTNIAEEKTILEYDYTFYRLQFDFEELLIEYSKKYKIIFIIDELDQNIDLLKKFPLLKMLITQNNALFLFVLSPKIYDANVGKIDGHETLFSQKLLMARPLFNEVRDFLDGIIIKDDHNHDWDNFKYYICYKSKMIFYKLYDVLRDHMMDINEDKSVTLNTKLDEQQLTLVNIQKTIEWTYNKHYHKNPSEWNKNGIILEKLYAFSDILSVQLQNTTIEIHEEEIIINGRHNKFYIDITAQSALNTFKEILIHQGYLKKINKSVLIIGTLKQFDVSKPIFIEEQKLYKKRYNNLLSTYIAIANLYENINNNNDSIFTIDNVDVKWQEFNTTLTSITGIAETMNLQHKKLYDDLNSNNVIYGSDHIKELLSEVKNAYKNSLIDFLNVLGNMILVTSSDCSKMATKEIRYILGMNPLVQNYIIKFNTDFFYVDIVILLNPTKYIIEQIPKSKKVLVICIHDENTDLLRLKEKFDIDKSTMSELLSKSSDNPLKIILIKPTLNYDAYKKLIKIITHL